ncbi:MAG: endolytic transglycosylase MltG [Myxococcales bacterium]|nr:endolytic transglycosylase MltG [Myxococcales bacterium]MCB9731603.1 endolytic transglycosylase MltG [Deltaproteobacteria bacterium]
MSARRTTSSRPRRRILARVLLFLFLALLVFGGWAFWLVHDRPDGNAVEVELVIPRGATLDDVVRVAREAGVAEHPTALWWTLRIQGVAGSLRAGRYRVPGDVNALELADALAERPAEGEQLVLTFVPGQSVWEDARRVEALGVGPAAEVLALAADHRFVSETLGLPVGPERPARTDGVQQTYLEGFLYPETYFLPLDATPEAAVRRATTEFKAVWKELTTRYKADLMAVTGRYHLTEGDIVTLASLLEEEVRAPEEAARVAGVFYNRLEKGMRLQTDPTLVYRPADVGREPTVRDRKDGTNPYNTYAIAGLPPGPICSPGRRALEAALRPERHELLYFVAKRDGTGAHAFARTLDEHEANVTRYLRGGE